MIYLVYLFAVLLLFAGFNHFIKPKFYNRFIPKPFPKLASNIVAGVVEIILGIALFLPSYRSLGGLGVLILMVLFLPLHIWDYLKEKPAFISKRAAFIRILIQFVFIYFGWWIWNFYA